MVASHEEQSRPHLTTAKIFGSTPVKTSYLLSEPLSLDYKTFRLTGPDIAAWLMNRCGIRRYPTSRSLVTAEKITTKRTRRFIRRSAAGRKRAAWGPRAIIKGTVELYKCARSDHALILKLTTRRVRVTLR